MRKEKSRLFDMFKAFAQIESSDNKVFLRKDLFYLISAICSEIPPNLCTMAVTRFRMDRKNTDSLSIEQCHCQRKSNVNVTKNGSLHNFEVTSFKNK